MPRTPDKNLEDRILRAAQRLWRTHGESALTLRAVAREADTTTTTVYKRFRNKSALQLALAGRVYQQISAAITQAKSVKQVYRLYLDYAEAHPWEYHLMFGPLWTELIGPGRPRSVQTWLQGKLAQEFGGNPREYERLYYSLFFVAHGAASLLTTTRHSQANKVTRKQCLAVCDALVKDLKTRNRA